MNQATPRSKRQIYVWSGYRTGSTALYNLASKALSKSSISHLRGFIGEAKVLSSGVGDPENTLLVKAHETLTAVDVSHLGSSKSLLILVALRPGREVARSWKHLSSESKQTRTVDEILATNIEIQKEILKLHENFPILVFSWHSQRINQISVLLRNLSGSGPSICNALSLLVMTSKPWNRIESFLESRGEKFFSFKDGHAPGTLWHSGHISKPKLFQRLSDPKHKVLPVTTHSLIQELDATTVQILDKFGINSINQKVFGNSHEA
jgi:hypothetical protein